MITPSNLYLYDISLFAHVLLRYSSTGPGDQCDMKPAYQSCGEFIHRNITNQPNMTSCVSCFAALAPKK